jgi:hypothetical protein
VGIHPETSLHYSLIPPDQLQEEAYWDKEVFHRNFFSTLHSLVGGMHFPLVKLQTLAWRVRDLYPLPRID